MSFQTLPQDPDFDSPVQYLAIDSARPGAKTFLIAGLLCFIPIVGFGMAAVYVFTGPEPNRYDAGRAFTASLVATAATIFIVVLSWVALAILIAALR